MTISVLNPHDRFFKETFGRLQVTRDFLRSYLPADVAAVVDLDTLELEKESFIDEELRQYASDLICRALAVDGQSLFIYFIFEHKSYPDPLTLFQLLRYAVRQLERLVESKEGLRPVICLLLYHGEESWPWGERLSGLYVGPEALRRYWPELQVEVLDFSAYSAAEIRGALLVRATLLLMQSVTRPDLVERLPAIFELLRGLTEGREALEYVEAAVRYLFSASRKVTPAIAKELVERVFEERGGEIVETVAEQLIQQGIEIGERKGRTEGRAEGRTEGRVEIVIALLTHRFDELSPSVRERVGRLGAEQLHRMTQAALDAHSLQDALARLEQIERGG